MLNPHSIRTQLIFGIAVPLLMVYSCFAGYELYWGRANRIREMEIFLRDATSLHATQGDTEFFKAREFVLSLSDFLSVREDVSREEIEALLRKMLQSHPEFIGSCVAFEPYMFEKDLELFAPFVFREKVGGPLMNSDLALEYPLPYTQEEWYSKPKALDKGTWSEPYFDEGGGNAFMCTCSEPFYRNGKLAGIVTVDIPLSGIRDLISKASSRGEHYWILSPLGTIISAPREELVMKKTIFRFADETHLPSLKDLARRAVQGESGISHFLDETHEDLWIAYAPFRSNGWSLLVTIPRSVILEELHRRLLYWSLTFLFFLLLIIGIIIFVTFRLTAPITQLTLFARELAAGNLDAKVGTVNTRNEVGELARTFDKMVVELQQSVNERIAEESARKLVEGELHTARRIQSSLLPRIFPPFPHRTEFQLHAVNEPATIMAGDFFDFFFIDEHTLVLVMADVSGKGVPAAMFMAVSRTAIRNFAFRGEGRNIEPSEVIHHVNRVLAKDNDDMMFVTCFYAQYSVLTGELKFVNAGHNPPYLVRGDGSLEELGPGGPILGVLEDAAFTQDLVQLQPNDLLFTFTDGVTEAFDEDAGKLFGEKRLEALLRELRHESVETICAEVLEKAVDFSGGKKHDDITLLALRCTTTSEREA